MQYILSDWVTMYLKPLIFYYVEFRLKRNISRQKENGFKDTLTDFDCDMLDEAVNLCFRMEKDVRFKEALASFRQCDINEETFTTVLDQLLIGDMNWARVLSVVTFTGALAVHCKDNGEEGKIDAIKHWANTFVEKKLRRWIKNNNGLVSLIRIVS